MLPTKNILMPANEAIALNIKHPLGKELEAIFSDLRKGNGTYKSKDLQKSGLSKVIKKYLGLKVNFVVSGNEDAWTLVPDVDKNNVMINEWRRVWHDSKVSNKLLKKRDVIKGGIDLAAPMATGDFSEMPAEVGMGRAFLNSKSGFSTRQAVAMLMHELGHWIVYLEMLGRTMTTNYVLSEGTRQLMGTNDLQRKYEIVKEIEESADIVIADPDVIVTAKRKEDIAIVLLDANVRSARTEMGRNAYDERAFEQLADQFANRMGYGVELAKVLDKVYRKHASYLYTKPSRFLLDEIKSVIWETIKLGLGLTLFPGFVVGWYLFTFLLSKPDNTYDTPKKRLEAMRNDKRTALRDKTLDQSVVDVLLLEISELDEMIAAVAERETNYLTLVWKYLIPPIALGESNKRLQQKMERLAASRMNESARRLAKV